MLLTLICVSSCFVALAKDVRIESEYAKKIDAAKNINHLTSSSFGNVTDDSTGQTVFSTIDVDLPGNSKLPVQFGRRLPISLRFFDQELTGLGNWDVEVPYIEGTFSQLYGWTMGNATAPYRYSRCSHTGAPAVEGGTFNAYEVFHGYNMHVPGVLDDSLLIDTTAYADPTDGKVYPWILKSMDRVGCLPSLKNGHPGEGFLLLTADGTRYFFDFMIERKAPTLHKGPKECTEFSSVSNCPNLSLRRKRMFLLATRIEDRFGNYVNYQYDSLGRPTSIAANDGRIITAVYSANSVSVSANGRSWLYSIQNGHLASVENPDGFVWKYSPFGQPTQIIGWTVGVDRLPSESFNPDDDCLYSTGSGNYWGTALFEVTHPSGAKANFELSGQTFYRSYVPLICDVVFTSPDGSTGAANVIIPNYFDLLSLTKMSISGAGMAQEVTTYNYGVEYYLYCDAIYSANGQPAGPSCNQDPCGWDISWTCSDSVGRWVVITKPDGAEIRKKFGVIYGVNEGQLLAEETLNAQAVVVRRIDYEYLSDSLAANQAFGANVGIPLTIDPMRPKIRPIISTQISQEGATYKSEVQLCNGLAYCFTEFAQPVRVKISNSFGTTRTDITEYENNLTYWILGQVKKKNTANAAPNGQATAASMVSSEVEYNAQALPWKLYEFGKLQQTLSYWPDGSLNTITDGRGNATWLGDYSRGIPRFIGHPGGTTESASVDGNGWITAVTDEIGAKTCYGYDAMGRVSSITYPSETQLGVCDTSRWHQTTIATEFINTAEHGIAAGHWRTALRNGTNAHINTYYDAMLRPVLEEKLDLNNIAGTLSQVVKRYDTSGRLSFQSYPTTNVGDVSTVTQGVRTFYDALDRVTRVEQDSELGTSPLATTTEYLPGLKTRVTNPRGFQTTTEYMAWDQPSYDLPILSQQPEGKTIQIERHPQFGWPLSVTQRNAANTLSQTRRYVYDGNAQMCKTIEPETGATVTGYDAAGNPAWSAAGLTGGDYGNAFDCSYVAANGSGRVVNRNYDLRNRLTTLNFPDGRGNQIWTYANDGLPASITTYNGLGNTHPVVNAYTYNNRRLLAGESVSQPGTYTWSLGYGYDAIGNLSNQTYPTGLNIDYAPNALGQPTKAGTYATGAQYYPNGALKQFTYGNGIVHTMTQNARQLPSRVTSSGGVLDYSYFYDANGNPTHIGNELTGGYDLRDRWMTYDQLDRLTDAGSGSFGGTDNWQRFTYNALDNMTSWKQPGVKDYAEYVYDNATNRLTSIRNTAGATVMGLDYDLQGNLYNKNGQIHSFDYGNRLRDVPGKESYGYDGLGRRVQTTKTDGSKTTLWHYSQAGQMLFSSDWDGANYANQKTHEHVYLAGSVVATIDHDWPSNAVIATRYQHTDALGSPVAETNPSGAVIERNNYEPYGAIIGKPTYSGIGYTGHVMDGATSLTYMQQRYYDQSVGRFLSVDPVTASSGTGTNFNRYKYAANNPYRFVDPDGRQEYSPDRSLVERVSDGVPSLKWLLSPSDTQAVTKGDMIREQLIFENSQPHSGRDVVFYLATAMSAGTGAAGARSIARIGAPLSRSEISTRLNAANRRLTTGESVAARKLTQHAQRSGYFAEPTGGIAKKNEQANSVLSKILLHRNLVVTRLAKGGVDYRIGKDGPGVRFDADGSFNTFVDPRKKK